MSGSLPTDLAARTAGLAEDCRQDLLRADVCLVDGCLTLKRVQPHFERAMQACLSEWDEWLSQRATYWAAVRDDEGETYRRRAAAKERLEEIRFQLARLREWRAQQLTFA